MTHLFSQDDPFVIATKHWHRLDDGRIQCDVCPRACKLHEGQRGLCFVRGRIDDQVKLTTYGRSSGFCVDPIEKKPLNHFLPGTAVLSFGTAGCNLAASSARTGTSPSPARSTRWPTVPTPTTSRARLTNYGCRSVAFTYNDPTIFWEYAVDVANACHDRGIKAVAVTAGYMCPSPAPSSTGTSTPPTST